MTTKRYSEAEIKRQIELELEGVQQGVDQYYAMVDKAKNKGQLTDIPSGLALLNLALEPLVKAIDDYKIPRRGGKWEHATRAFLQRFDSVEAAYIIARTLINLMIDEQNVQTPSIRVTRNLIDHIEYMKFKDQAGAYLKTVERNLETNHARHRRTVIMRAKRGLGIEDESYSPTEKLHIGARLIDLFIEHTGLVERVRVSYSKTWVIQPTQMTVDWLEKQDETIALLNPVYQPMVIEPVDWVSPYGGGFLSNTQSYKIKLVKTSDKTVLEAIENNEMPEVLKAVNTLQKTPWQINKRILQVMEEAKELPTRLGGLPKPDEIPKPDKFWNSNEEFEYLKENQPELIKDWKKKCETVEAQNRTERGKRIALALKLNMARKFKNEDSIYFVYTLDFRGRVYPVQSYLNPQGDDISKGLLKFSEGKPLGETGAYWLKVHLANKFGVDKVSFDDRVVWVDDHKQYILDSALRPITGEKFWTEADDPYQFLAACFEYQGYHEQGEDFISYLPIAMDGTCNGLQHFSAILKDRKGARATNLLPADKPQDIYQEVVDVVNMKLAQEAMDESVDLEDRNYASLWLGKVDRSLAKRNVMTQPYGVTLIGMKDQLLTELDKRDTELGEAGAYLGVEDNFKPAYYLAKKLKEAIDEVVIASNNAMKYLQKVARVVAHQETPIYWKTPIGFLAYQKYLQQDSIRVETYWGKDKVRVRLGLRLDTDKLDKRRQVTGVSPNFVHSLDASHLMATINTAKEEHGLYSFATIHDSFAVHAADTEKFSKIIRTEFAKQYEGNMLEDWTEQVKAQIDPEIHEELPELPSMGDLDITKVIESKYFFA